jgi:hypothetical protein
MGAYLPSETGVAASGTTITSILDACLRPATPMSDKGVTCEAGELTIESVGRGRVRRSSR